MDHIAFLSKKLGMLDRIISGEKTIESRWYKFQKAPFRSITEGDTVYFKEGGDPVQARAKVKDVIFYDNLNKQLFNTILKAHGKGICIDESYWETVKDKRLVTLIFIKQIEKVPPFNINKSGYGSMAAWISVDSIDSIRA